MEHNREMIRRIMIAVNKIDGIYDIAAKKAGVKPNTLALLYALDDGEPHTQKEICEHWLIPRTTLNTIVSQCVDGGYITLDASGHKKEKDIRITDAGRVYARAVLEHIYAMEGDAMEETLASYTEEFVCALECFTDKLKRGLETK